MVFDLEEKLDDVSENLLGGIISKPLMIILGVIAVVVILGIGLVVLWIYKLITALIFAIVTLLVLWVLHQIDALERYPYLILLPLPMFLLGYFIEKSGLTMLTIRPLSLEEFSLTINMSTFMLFAVIGLVAVGLLLSFLKKD